jgi:hypothetical protein
MENSQSFYIRTFRCAEQGSSLYELSARVAG